MQNIDIAKKRLMAFMVQNGLRQASWDGHMLTCLSSGGAMLSSMDLQHSQAMRPMWLHLEQWLTENSVPEINIDR